MLNHKLLFPEGILILEPSSPLEAADFGRGNEVAARHGDVLQAVHESNNSIFRSRPIDRGEGVAKQGVMDL